MRQQLSCLFEVNRLLRQVKPETGVYNLQFAKQHCLTLRKTVMMRRCTSSDLTVCHAVASSVICASFCRTMANCS